MEQRAPLTVLFPKPKARARIVGVSRVEPPVAATPKPQSQNKPVPPPPPPPPTPLAQLLRAASPPAPPPPPAAAPSASFFSLPRDPRVRPLPEPELEAEVPTSNPMQHALSAASANVPVAPPPYRTQVLLPGAYPPLQTGAVPPDRGAGHGNQYHAVRYSPAHATPTSAAAAASSSAAAAAAAAAAVERELQLARVREVAATFGRNFPQSQGWPFGYRP
jgi:hypothetical protein